jgi:hypothetical protein
VHTIPTAHYRKQHERRRTPPLSSRRFDGKTIELDTMTSNWVAGKKPLERGPGPGYEKKSSYI